MGVKGYASIIFRRSYTDLALPGALMDRAHQWLDLTPAEWNERDKTWKVGGGGSLTFGYLEHEKDKYRYQSAEFQYIAFDELTEFLESQYTFLFSRLRRLAGSEVPLRMRAASNPGGEGHEWVKGRFVTGDRVFIPAKLEDNPFLDLVEYEESLSKLDPITRAQLRDGNWDVVPGGHKFQRQWFKVVEDYPHGVPTVRYWDLAATEPKKGKDPDWTAGVKVCKHEGQYWVLDVKRGRMRPKEVEELVKQTAQLDGRDTLVYMEQEPGASGVSMIDHYARSVLDGFAFRGNKVTGNKEIRANPVSSAAEAGNVFILNAPWNEAFLDELVLFPLGAHDDQVDALSGALEMITESQGYESAMSGASFSPYADTY